NLTLFRSLRLGAWARRRILSRLILRRRAGPLRLLRSIRFAPAEVVFRDRLQRTGAAAIRSIELTRSFTPIHMGSAKYFHRSELEDPPVPLMSDEAARLNTGAAVDREFTVRFTNAGAELDAHLEVSTRV